MKDQQPDCYECKYRRPLVGDAHSMCTNSHARVVGYTHGISRGWFQWPLNFDPAWLKYCTGFEQKEKT